MLVSRQYRCLSSVIVPCLAMLGSAWNADVFNQTHTVLAFDKRIKTNKNHFKTLCLLNDFNNVHSYVKCQQQIALNKKQLSTEFWYSTEYHFVLF